MDNKITPFKALLQRGPEECQPEKDQEEDEEVFYSTDTLETIEEAPLKGWKLYTALLGLDVLLFLAALDLTVIATVYIEIGSKLNALTLAEWTVTSYMLAATAVQPLFGKISDILGRKLALSVSVLLFAIGSAMCAMSKQMSMLIASRAVQGVGGGGLMGLIFVVVADLLSERERGKFVGIFTATWGIASAVAPLVGGLVLERFSWPLIFWINLPLSAVALGLVVFCIQLPKPHGTLREKLGRIDFAGSLVFVLGIVPLLLGLSWGGTGQGHRWQDPLVIGCLAGGLCVLGVFMLVEYKAAKEPIVSPRLLSIRNVSVSSACHLFFGAAGYAPLVFVPQWSLLIRGSTPIQAGTVLLPFTAGSVVTSVLGGWWMARRGRYRRLIVGGAFLLAAGNTLLVLLGKDPPRGLLPAALCLSGLGAGASIQPLMMAAQASVQGTDMAAVTALCAFLRSLGAIVCVAVLSSAIHSVARTGLAHVAVRHPWSIFVIVRSIDDHSAVFQPQVPGEIRELVLAALAKSMRTGFLVLIPMSVINLVASACFEHRELHRSRKKTIQ